MPSERQRSQRQSLEIPAHHSDVDLDAVESPVVLDLSSAPLPSVHVSNANLAELKAAMDEAVKRVRTAWSAVLTSRTGARQAAIQSIPLTHRRETCSRLGSSFDCSWQYSVGLPSRVRRYEGCVVHCCRCVSLKS